MAQRHPWDEITEADLPRVNALIHDATIQAFAIRPELVRIELKPEGAGVIQLQFLDVSAIHSTSLDTQNVVFDLQVDRLEQLAPSERDVLVDALPDHLVWTLSASVGMRLQIACASAGLRLRG